VQVLSLGYVEPIDTCIWWQASNHLTYEVLSDIDGSITLDYTNFLGFPLHPWTAIVSVDRILEYSDDTYAGGAWHVEDLIAVFEELFDPTIGTDADELDFGGVHVGESADLDLTITNDMTGLLEITDISTSSTAFTVSQTTGQVFAAEDSLVVTVTFAPEQEITYYETLTITSATDDTYVVDLTGIGLPEGIQSDPALPQIFAVSCYPNPFNAELTIQLSLPARQDVGLGIYDLQGRQTGEAWQGWLNAGLHKVNWSDASAPSGLYFVKVQGQGWEQVQKVVMVR
jgi:hypothetical protein